MSKRARDLEIFMKFLESVGGRSREAHGPFANDFARKRQPWNELIPHTVISIAIVFRRRLSKRHACDVQGMFATVMFTCEVV